MHLQQEPEPLLTGHLLGTRGRWLQEERRTPKAPVLLMGHLFGGAASALEVQPFSLLHSRARAVRDTHRAPAAFSSSQGGALSLARDSCRTSINTTAHAWQPGRVSKAALPGVFFLGRTDLKPRPDGSLSISVKGVMGAQPGLCPHHPPLSAAASTLC